MFCPGSVPAGTVLYIPFATYGKTNGESITMTGLAVTDIEIYKNGAATQRASDAGYTLLDTDGIDFDGITGIHGFSIDLADNTDAGFFAVGSWYWVIVSAVTVDGQTVNFIAAVFRIGAAEHTAGYPVATVKDGTGTGELDTASGVVLARDHTGAALATAAALDVVDNFLDTEIADIQARLPAALSAGGFLKADVQEWKGATAPAMTGDAFARLGAPAGASVSADVAAVKAETAAIVDDTGTSGVVVAAASKTGYALSAAGVQAIWDALTSALTTAGSIGKRIVDFLTGDIFARLGAPAGASIAADIATRASQTSVDTVDDFLDTEVAAIKAKTDLIPAAPAAVGDIPTAVQNADALLGRAIQGGATGGRTVTSALRKIRNKVAVSGGTMTVYQEDDSTADHTAAVATTAGDPISSVDPA